MLEGRRRPNNNPFITCYVNALTSKVTCKKSVRTVQVNIDGLCHISLEFVFGTCTDDCFLAVSTAFIASNM